MRAALRLTLALLAIPGAAVAAGPTDIARVDDYIDAPRALFGRTRAELERRLGVPTQERLRAGTIVLFWPGLEVAMSPSARVAANQRARGGAAAARRPRRRRAACARRGGAGPGAGHDGRARLLPRRRRVPDSVEFFFRDGRVTRIEWRFWAD